MEEGFEKPFVEKYRPVTLEEVVGKIKRGFITCRQ
jgi:hypothetical protein